MSTVIDSPPPEGLPKYDTVRHSIAGGIMLQNRKILLTGATGQIAGPIAENFAKDNEVWCAARFSDPNRKAELEAIGINPCRWDMGSGDASMLPDDFTHVVHSALQVSPDYDESITNNAEASALLMQHCRNAEAFLHVSSSCVYKRHEDHPHHAYAETDPLGGLASYAEVYPVMAGCPSCNTTRCPSTARSRFCSGDDRELGRQ